MGEIGTRSYPTAGSLTLTSCIIIFIGGIGIMCIAWGNLASIEQSIAHSYSAIGTASAAIPRLARISTTF
jgi:hypothetical protein